MRPPFLRGFWKLAWVETKIFAREPMGFIGTLAVPVVVFVALGRAFGAARPEPAAALDLPFNAAIKVSFMLLRDRLSELL